MNQPSTLAALVLGAALAFPAAGSESADLHDLAPLPVHGQFLPTLGFLDFEPEGAPVLAQNRWQVEVVETIANTFAKSEAIDHALHVRPERGPVTPDFIEAVGAGRDGGPFLIDGETLCTALRMTRSTGSGVELGLVLRVLDFSGGALDSAIEGFHSALSVDQGGRPAAARNEYEVYLHPDGTEPVSQKPPAVGLGDASLSAKFALLKPTGRDFLAFEVLLKLPTGRVGDLYGSGSVDVGGRLLYSHFWHATGLHVSAGLIHLGPSERLHTRAQTVVSVMVGIEQQLAQSRTSLSLQSNSSTSPLRGLGMSELEAIVLEVSGGVRYRLGRDGALFFAVTENLAHFNNTADLSVHLGWSRRF